MGDKKKHGCFINLLSFICLIGLMVWGAKSCDKFFNSPAVQPSAQALTDSNSQPVSQKNNDEFIKIDKSAQMQADRLYFIKELQKKGIIDKITSSGTIPNVWVGTTFMLLDYSTKKQFVSVVYTYYFDGKNYGDFVRLKNNLTGKTVGEYNPYLGELKMK